MAELKNTSQSQKCNNLDQTYNNITYLTLQQRYIKYMLL